MSNKRGFGLLFDFTLVASFFDESVAFPLVKRGQHKGCVSVRCLWVYIFDLFSRGAEQIDVENWGVLTTLCCSKQIVIVERVRV